MLRIKHPLLSNFALEYTIIKVQAYEEELEWNKTHQFLGLG